MGRVYVVATPIGNLKDITYRAVEILHSVNLILCEDTRHSRKLFQAYDIRAELWSCPQQKQRRVAEQLCERLGEDGEAAYVSDAGTPGISDPGSAVVEMLYNAGHEVVPIPGPSALSAILSIDPFPGKTVIFEGFLSIKRGKRRSRIHELLASADKFILYESPYRIVAVLAEMAEAEPERHLVLGREMTKIHEEYRFGTTAEIHNDFAQRDSIKGEFALLVSGAKKR